MNMQSEIFKQKFQKLYQRLVEYCLLNIEKQKYTNFPLGNLSICPHYAQEAG